MEHIHCIGIGGIGMSALAQLLVHEGKTVSGSDRDPSPQVHDLLREKGIAVYTKHDPSNIPPQTTLVIYSDAVTEGSEGYAERMHALERGIRTISYFQALGEIANGKRTVAITGTHGKTTTTGMVAKLLTDAGANPTAIVGSILKDFHSNFVPGNPDLFVVEACEYRGHVLEFTPAILVVTNIEWDHTDYYPNLPSLQAVFKKAIQSATEAVVTNPHDPNIAPLLEGVAVPIIDYTKEPIFESSLIGTFNQANAQAAVSASRIVVPDATDEVLRSSLASFQGTWRRFEAKGATPSGALVFDDYAHHPTAVQKTLEAVRYQFPGKNIVVAFHPHLYSRTRDLMEEFASAFSSANQVLLAPIYAAREVPIPGVTSEALAEKITTHGVPAEALPSLQAIIEQLRERGDNDLIITMGAGDIYKVAEAITTEVKK